jgi:hypothetical protein
MHDLWGSLRAGHEAELSEHLQHGRVLGQHVRNQLFEARVTRQCSQMPHENRPEPPGLIGIDDDESDLGLTGPDNNIASTADDDGVSVFVDFCDEGDMIFEIDVQEESHLALRKAFLRDEEASLQRLGAGSSDGGEHPGPVIGTERADFDRTMLAWSVVLTVALYTPYNWLAIHLGGRPKLAAAQILVVPDLEAGNMLAKNLAYLAKADGAGIVLGARVPIVLTSRADSPRARMASCAVATLYADARRRRSQIAAA